MRARASERGSSARVSPSGGATFPATDSRIGVNSLPRLDRARELLGYLGEAPAPPTLKDGQREMLEAAVERLEAVEWTPPEIESALESVREAGGWSRGKFLTPIRESVAGKVTPPIHHTLALLSKPEALGRMRRVLT